MKANPNEPHPTPRGGDKDEASLFPLLDGYWVALRRGTPEEPSHWAQAHQGDRKAVRDLEVLAALHDVREMVLEDSDATATAAESSLIGPGMETALPWLPPGTRIGSCRIKELLGCGGMGEVYLAEDEALKRPVAVKLLPARLAGDTGAVQRFSRSVLILAQLEPHPNVVAAHYAREHLGRLYLVMEYVPGLSLKAHLRQSGSLSVAEACGLIRQVAVGLDHAHRHGIVHRDIKPSNLVLSPEGIVKILDLGLARSIGDVAGPGMPQTDPGALLGTLDYMAPEQAMDARLADGRSDQYSLGCTFYFLLTGRPPFDDHSDLDKIMAHAMRTPPPVQELRPDVPRPVADIVHRLLAKKPEGRYPSARDLVEALDAAALS